MTAKKKAAITPKIETEIPDFTYTQSNPPSTSNYVERFKPHEERLFEKVLDLEQTINSLYHNGFEVGIHLRRESGGSDYPRIKIETTLTLGQARNTHNN